MASAAMAGRWQCNYDKTYDYFEGILNKTVCKDEQKFTIPAALASAACTAVVRLAANLGSDALSYKFECNRELVYEDLKHSDKLCLLLNLM